jgi:anti-sigma regulatory factor (Ser/Thr protein kinase)
MPILTARLDLHATVHSPRVARHVVDDLLTAWAARQYSADAALVVSELVTNVVDHVGDGAELAVELSLSDRTLRLSVTDGSAVRPVLRDPAESGPRGRGMRLVSTLAHRWGCDGYADGKRVWVELRAA